MLERASAFRSGEIALPRLVQELRGWMAASNIHDQALVDEFWIRLSPIDGEAELRTEPWAPAGSPNDERLDSLLADLTFWIDRVLAEQGNEPV